MSDSDSEYDWRASEIDRKHEIAFLDDNITIMNPSAPYGYVDTLRTPDDMLDNWDRISHPDKHRSGQMMKMCAFWVPLLLQPQPPESSPVTCWATDIGLVKPYKDLDLENIYRIEILEAILRALVQGTLHKELTKQVVLISNSFYMHSPAVLEDALQWLERTGEPRIRQRVLEIGPLELCFKALHLIFVEFAQYIKAMSLSFEETMKALTARPADMLIRRSEEMKRRGNEHFQKKLYQEAVRFYSKALKYFPDNHIIYSNMALCHIKSNNYLKAMGDGKRATLIKPLWAKGHYRFCEALFSLGQARLALEANSSARILCKDDCEGMKDLENQKIRFKAYLKQAHMKWDLSTRVRLKEPTSPRTQSPKVKAEKKATAGKSSKDLNVSRT